MRHSTFAVAASVLILALSPPTLAQSASTTDPVRILVERLNLQKYKATIKGLTQFGDRRQSTNRNRAAIDWIEAELKSYGYTNAKRLAYEYIPRPQPSDRPSPNSTSAGPVRAVAGGRARGERAPTGVNIDPDKQPDAKLRALNMQPSTPGSREEVYCTKIGVTHPDEMYIVGAHTDGIGWGEAVNGDGSGAALVMELAPIFSSPDVQTDRSIRFILWNNEETGLNGSRAYVAQRQVLQGKEDLVGSGHYLEPKWLGVGQHDMMMFDHGILRAVRSAINEN
jgi:hypothetical protein